MRKFLLVLILVALSGCMNQGTKKIGKVEAEKIEEESSLVKAEASLANVEKNQGEMQQGLVNVSAGISGLKKNLGEVQHGLANVSAGQAELTAKLAQNQQGLANVSAGMADIEAKLAQTQQGVLNLSAGQTDVSGTMISGGIIVGVVGLCILGLLSYKLMKVAFEKNKLSEDIERRESQILEIVRAHWDGRKTLPTEVYEMAKKEEVVPEAMHQTGTGHAKWLKDQQI